MSRTAAKSKPFPYRYPGVSVFKRSDRRAGDDPWLIAYREPHAPRRSVLTASADLDVTARTARQISQRLDMHRLGQIDPRQERIEQQEARPLLGTWQGGRYQPGHLDDYREWMIARDRTVKQAGEVCRRARKMIRLCRWRTIQDVHAETLETAVAHHVRRRRDRSLKTCNDYLKAPSQLCRWMASPKVGRCRQNPLAQVEKYNALTDVRHPRRALTREEILKVIAETKLRGRRRGLSGEDRAMYYLVRMHTGFRNLETASLTPESFDLDGTSPTITVAAAYSKHRKQDIQPITAFLAGELRPWLKDKPEGQPVFPVRDKPHLMWKHDLEASGIPYCQNGRFADLHAIRHTFATELAASGASIKVVQKLMRHADIRLTARYMNPTLADELAALAYLPGAAPGAAPQQPLGMTGS